MPLARARSSSAYFRPSSRPFSLVYWSRGRSALSAGAATARLMTPAAVKRRGSATAAAPASSLLLKNLLRADGDGLSPPSLAAGERDVLARHPRRRPRAIPDREGQVLAGGEMARMLLPGRPLLAGRAGGREECRRDDRERVKPISPHLSRLT